MAEAIIGLAASVVSLISVAKTCMDAYEVVSDGKHASEDLNKLVSLLSIERVRFLLWCQYVGITDVLRLSQFSPAHNDLDPQDALRLTPRLQRSYIVDGVTRTLYDISRTFKDSSDLLQSYTTSSQVSFSSSLMAMSSSVSGSVALGDYLYLDERARLAAREKSRPNMSMIDRSKWAFKDKKKFKTLVDQLRLHNDGLVNVLTMVERNQLRRQNELLVTTTPLANFVSTAAAAEVNDHGPPQRPPGLPAGPANEVSLQSYIGDGNEGLLQVLELQQRRRYIDDAVSGVNTDSVHRQTSKRRLSVSGLDPDLRILPSEITIPLGEKSSQQRRLHTYYKKNVPVVVEWKHYSARVNSDLLAHLKRRVSMLTLQLQQSSRTPDFSILGCLGYFEDSSHHRMGIIFEYPRRDPTLNPVSLHERLVQDRSSRVVRDLDQRFSVAKALTLTMYRLHSVGWLHKSFRSDNVLFFEAQDQPESTLSTPYICGFDFARQDSPTELTENVPTVLLSQMSDRERSLYRHPDLDLQPSSFEPDKDDMPETVEAKLKAAQALADKVRFNKAYDVYSLGIVLLEIGLWCPAKSICRSSETVSEFKQRIHTKLLHELRYRMGRAYFEIVKKCLTGGFSTLSSQNQDPAANGSTSMETTESQSRTWLQSFLNEAVNELERCSV